MMIKIYKRYEIPPHKGLRCGQGRTQQHFKEECDINWIIKHYNGQTPPPPVYGDVSMFDGLQDAIEMVDNAQSAFMDLPSNVRDDFGHNPVAFFEFARNPANYQYLVDNGLAVAKKSAEIKKSAETQQPPNVVQNSVPKAEKSGTVSS